MPSFNRTKRNSRSISTHTTTTWTPTSIYRSQIRNSVPKLTSNIYSPVHPVDLDLIQKILKLFPREAEHFQEDIQMSLDSNEDNLAESLFLSYPRCVENARTYLKNWIDKTIKPKDQRKGH